MATEDLIRRQGKSAGWHKSASGLIPLPHCTIRPASGTLSGSMDGAGDILSHQIPPSLHSVLITQILLIKRQPCPNQVQINTNQNQNRNYSRTPTNHLIDQPDN